MGITFNPAVNAACINVGDQIQLGLQGPLYTVSAAGGGAATLDTSQGLSTPWSGNPPGVPFRVLRQPVSTKSAFKSAAAALQLPSPAVVDLTQSGTDAAAWGTAAGGLMIVFAPDGSVDRVYSGGNGTRPTGPLYLMIGSRENVNERHAESEKL